MKTVLITGANKGIGFETAKQLAKLGYFVFLGSRDENKGIQAVEKFKALGLTNIDWVLLDISDIDSIKEARKEMEAKISQLDVLVNNAGILGKVPQPAATVAVDEIRKVFDTNFFGTIQVTQEFIPLLQKSEAGKIVNVTSGLGSLTRHSDPSWKYYKFKSGGYSVSKTALNAYTVMLAFGLKDTNIKVNVVDPGYTATDFNNYRGENTPEHAAKVIVEYATFDGDGPSGKFFDEDGEVPW